MCLKPTVDSNGQVFPESNKIEQDGVYTVSCLPGYWVVSTQDQSVSFTCGENGVLNAPDAEKQKDALPNCEQS